jgi:hypothetical protein
MGSVNPLWDAQCSSWKMGRSIPLELYNVLDSVGASIVAASTIKGAIVLRSREMRVGGSV